MAKLLYLISLLLIGSCGDSSQANNAQTATTQFPAVNLEESPPDGGAQRPQ